ncbi:MAG: PilN domain-containing protein [Bacillota bacterium]
MRVNLIDKKKSGLSFNLFAVSILLLIGIVLGVILLNYIYLERQLTTLENNKKLVEDRLSELEKKKEEYIEVKDRLDELEDEKVESDRESDENFLWDELLISLSHNIPKKTMLRNIRVNNRQITLSGRSANSEEINSFINNLEKDNLISNIELQQISSGNDLEYSLQMQLNTERGN